MRRTINILIPTLVVALVAGAFSFERERQEQREAYQAVQDDLVRLRGQAAYRGAMRQVPVSRTGFPLDMRDAWFNGEALPLNVLLPGRRCWLDIAPPGDMFEHPPDPVAFRLDQAGFWYNPNLGVVRARVPWGHSVVQALAAYNRVNGTDLEQLPSASSDGRRPRAHDLHVGAQTALVRRP